MGEKKIEVRNDKEQSAKKSSRQIILSAEEQLELDRIDFLTMMAEREYM
ncbi:MAG: hypothetical protein J5657_06085 [Clostridiales bacterium]|jgi:hypothetical protein|nr:hypothetical protein [Clostridiales bacterium]